MAVGNTLGQAARRLGEKLVAGSIIQTFNVHWFDDDTPFLELIGYTFTADPSLVEVQINISGSVFSRASVLPILYSHNTDADLAWYLDMHRQAYPRLYLRKLHTYSALRDYQLGYLADLVNFAKEDRRSRGWPTDYRGHVKRMMQGYASREDCWRSFREWRTYVTQCNLAHTLSRGLSDRLIEQRLCCADHILMRLTESHFARHFRHFYDPNPLTGMTRGSAIASNPLHPGDVLFETTSRLQGYISLEQFLIDYFTFMELERRREVDLATNACHPDGFAFWHCCDMHRGLYLLFDYFNFWLEYYAIEYGLDKVTDASGHHVNGVSPRSRDGIELLIHRGGIDRHKLKLTAGYLDGKHLDIVQRFT